MITKLCPKCRGTMHWIPTFGYYCEQCGNDSVKEEEANDQRGLSYRNTGDSLGERSARITDSGNMETTTLTAFKLSGSNLGKSDGTVTPIQPSSISNTEIKGGKS